MGKLVGYQIQESFILEFLLQLLARQGHLWTQEEYANKLLDGKFYLYEYCEQSSFIIAQEPI